MRQRNKNTLDRPCVQQGRGSPIRCLRSSCSPEEADWWRALPCLRFVSGCRWGGTLCAMGGVGVLAATWALFFPPARPRGVLRNLGDTPRPPPEGAGPLWTPPGLHEAVLLMAIRLGWSLNLSIARPPALNRLGGSPTGAWRGTRRCSSPTRLPAQALPRWWLPVP